MRRGRGQLGPARQAAESDSSFCPPWEYGAESHYRPAKETAPGGKPLELPRHGERHMVAVAEAVGVVALAQIRSIGHTRAEGLAETEVDREDHRSVALE